MRQTKFSAFIDFKPEVIDISKSNLKSIDYKDRKDDLIPKIAIGLTKNVLMQDNFIQKLELQREIRNITPFINGKNMSQLRSDKKKKGRCRTMPKIVT